MLIDEKHLITFHVGNVNKSIKLVEDFCEFSVSGNKRLLDPLAVSDLLCQQDVLCFHFILELAKLVLHLLAGGDIDISSLKIQNSAILISYCVNVDRYPDRLTVFCTCLGFKVLNEVMFSN